MHSLYEPSIPHASLGLHRGSVGLASMPYRQTQAKTGKGYCTNAWQLSKEVHLARATDVGHAPIPCKGKASDSLRRPAHGLLRVVPAPHPVLAWHRSGPRSAVRRQLRLHMLAQLLHVQCLSVSGRYTQAEHKTATTCTAS